MRAWSLAESLDAAGDTGEAWQAGLAALQALGIDRAIWMDILGPRGPQVRSNCPRDWLSSYGRDVSGGGDPFVSYCLQASVPVRTGVSYLDRYDYLTRPEKDFIAQASDATATRSGTSVTTLRGRAGWNLMADMEAGEFDALFAAQGADIMLCAHMIHTALASAPPATAALTARERDCLTYVATGCRTSEIAARLGITDVTVELHLRNARKRLGARTRDEAVARALLGGAIRL